MFVGGPRARQWGVLQRLDASDAVTLTGVTAADLSESQFRFA